MKIVFNTKRPADASSAFYRQGLSGLDCVEFCDWGNYDKYDIALFMTYKNDLKELAAAKKQNPKIKIGVLDPRGQKKVEPFLDKIDFFVVDSLEMKDFFSRYGKPICLYAEYPYFDLKKKEHVEKDKIIVGYHGNKVHLAGMYPHITQALELLGEEFDLELWMVYNIKGLDKLRFGLPENVKLRHIQWDQDVYEEYLCKVDIGIVPGLMPVNNIGKIRRKTRVCKYMFLDSEDDYILKFKMPSNAGRIIVFARLGIPVAADFYPSALHVIEDGRTGRLACSAGGWYSALKELILDWRLRQRLSDNMQAFVTERFDYDIQNKNFSEFLENITAETNAPNKAIEMREITFGDKAGLHKESIHFLLMQKMKLIKGRLKLTDKLNSK